MGLVSPLAQLVHCESEVKPVCDECLPALQGLHSESEARPVWLEYLPAEQRPKH